MICGFTRWAGTEYHAESHLFQRHSECWFLRFDNIPHGGGSGAAGG